MPSKLTGQLRHHKDVRSRRPPVRTAWALDAVCHVLDILIAHAPQHARDEIDVYFAANKEGVRYGADKGVVSK